MDAAEKCWETRRMGARGDVDDGAECGGAAWASWLGRVRGVSVRGCPPRADRRG